MKDWKQSLFKIKCSKMGPPLRDSLTVENCITAWAMPVQCAAMAVPWPGFGVGLRAWEQILFLPRRGSGSLWEQILFLLHRHSGSAWEQILFLPPRRPGMPYCAMPVPCAAMAGPWPCQGMPRQGNALP